MTVSCRHTLVVQRLSLVHQIRENSSTIEFSVLVVYRLILVYYGREKIQRRPDRIQQSAAEHHCLITVLPMNVGPSAHNIKKRVRDSLAQPRYAAHPESPKLTWIAGQAKLIWIAGRASCSSQLSASRPRRSRLGTPPQQSACGRSPAARLAARSAPPLYLARPRRTRPRPESLASHPRSEGLAAPQDRGATRVTCAALRGSRSM